MYFIPDQEKKNVILCWQCNSVRTCYSFSILYPLIPALTVSQRTWILQMWARSRLLAIDVVLTSFSGKGNLSPTVQLITACYLSAWSLASFIRWVTGLFFFLLFLERRVYCYHKRWSQLLYLGKGAITGKNTFIIMVFCQVTPCPALSHDEWRMRVPCYMTGDPPSSTENTTHHTSSQQIAGHLTNAPLVMPRWEADCKAAPAVLRGSVTQPGCPNWVPRAWGSQLWQLSRGQGQPAPSVCLW